LVKVLVKISNKTVKLVFLHHFFTFYHKLECFTWLASSWCRCHLQDKKFLS